MKKHNKCLRRVQLVFFTLLSSAFIVGCETNENIQYYVSVDGDNLNDGSIERPFRTIQKAASVAMPGDYCVVAPGVYRETVTINQSGQQGKPITFRAAKKGTVTIIGTDPIPKWTKHDGNIYKAKMDWSLGKNNQLFFNNKPLQEARWPNDKDGDPMTPDGAEFDDGNVDYIKSNKFPDNWKQEHLKGAVVWAIADRSWSSWTRTITNYDPKNKSIFYPSFAGDWWLESRHNPNSKIGMFYLVGAMEFLDAPGEWFYNETEKVVYLWAPDNKNPNKHQIEAKSRQLGLNMQKSSWITVDGINLLGCSMDLEESNHCTIKNIKANYISHTKGGNTRSRLGEKSGIYMSGHHNQLLNCEIAYSTGSGVSLSGMDNAVVNCWIHHINYIGSYCSPIRMSGMRHLISHNTISHSARDGINPGGTEHLIQYNDIGFVGLICHDLGILYTGGSDGGNTRICYNYCHDNPGSKSDVGIYLDNYMKNYMVDHNVIWNVGNGIRLNRPTGFCMVINNTVFGDITNNWGPWQGQKTQWGSHVMNNIYTDTIRMNKEVVKRGNLRIEKKLPQYFNADTQIWGTKIPGKDKGIFIEGFTPEKNINIGAFQDSIIWSAGHDFIDPPKVQYIPNKEFLRNYIRNASFEYARSYQGVDKIDKLIYWTRTDAGTATVKSYGGFNTPPANARNSIHANSVKLDGVFANGIQQVVKELRPNTKYLFSGYVKHKENVQVAFSIKASNKMLAIESSKLIALKEEQTWRLVQGEFKTGVNDTEVVITILKQGNGVAFIDDIGIIPAQYNSL